LLVCDLQKTGGCKYRKNKYGGTFMMIFKQKMGKKTRKNKISRNVKLIFYHKNIDLIL
jgi:hypothetical protein